MTELSPTARHGLFHAKNATTGKYLNGTLGWLADDPRTAAEFGKLRLSAEPAVWVAVGETVILLHPPSTFSRCFNRDGEGMPAE